MAMEFPMVFPMVYGFPNGFPMVFPTKIHESSEASVASPPVDTWCTSAVDSDMPWTDRARPWLVPGNPGFPQISYGKTDGKP